MLTGNKVKAINTFSVPLLTYSFGVVKWTKADPEALERAVRVAFIKHRMCHSKSSIERDNLQRAVGGRGVINIQALCVSKFQ